jgi:glutamate-1-semialdehyde aminotransferase
LAERVSAGIARHGLDARIVTVGSLFQVFRGEAGAAFSTGAGEPSDLHLGLLLAGFMIAPRGMGAIPTVATETDVDELGDAMISVLSTIAMPALSGSR